jgi:hypothetical protein
MGIAVLAVGVAAVVWVAVSGDDPAPTYTAATREEFLAACTADGGEPVEPACACLYDAIEEHIPYERYREVSNQLLTESELPGPLPLPEDFEELVQACRRAAPLPTD